jgi:hypothetical protein
MAPQPDASLRDRSPIDSPSYALRADLADRLAVYRHAAREGGRAVDALSQPSPRQAGAPLRPEGATPGTVI